MAQWLDDQWGQSPPLQLSGHLRRSSFAREEVKRFGDGAACPPVKWVEAPGEREDPWLSLCCAGISSSRRFRVGLVEFVGVGDLELLVSVSWKRHGIPTQCPVSA